MDDALAKCLACSSFFVTVIGNIAVLEIMDNGTDENLHLCMLKSCDRYYQEHSILVKVKIV